MYKKIIINSIIIFLLSALFHSAYNYLPNFISSIFFPVNESIWEHMKLIFTSYMFFLLIQVLFYKKKDKNLVSSFVLSAIFNILIFLLIYIPIYKIFKENMIVTLVIYFFTILISNYVKYQITRKKENKKLNTYLSFSIFVIYLIFTILTYYPLKIDMFYDPKNSIYGIYKFYS